MNIMIDENLSCLTIILILFFLNETNCINSQKKPLLISAELKDKDDNSPNSLGLSFGTFTQDINPTILLKISTCCKLNVSRSSDINWTCKNNPYPSSTAVHQSSSVYAAWKIPANLVSTNGSMDVLLQYKKPICSSSFLKENILWSSSDSKKANSFYTNGYLKVGMEYYAPDEYCIDGFTEEGIDIQICPPDCGNSRACIPKCCPLDEVYNIGVTSGKGCRKSKGINNSSHQNILHFNPPLYHDFYTQLSTEEISHAPLPHYFLWKLANFRQNCPLNKTSIFPLSPFVARNISKYVSSKGQNLEMHPMDFRIRRDGAFLYKNAVTRKCYTEIDPKKILCFDAAQDFSEEQGHYRNSQDEMIVFLCSVWNFEDLEEIKTRNPKNLIYGILMITFSIFPLITSFIYIMLWSRQNVHGWTIAATTGTLFFMYIFQGSAFLIGGVYGRKITDSFSCTVVAILSHFFFLATFTWLSVMCCDLWWTFRSLTPTNRRSKGMKRFINYSIFGWGLPAAFVTVGIILDHVYISDDCISYTLPGYGAESCWIIDSSQGVFVYYPVAILLSSNIVFFAVTCFKLCRYRQNTKFATKREASSWQSFSRFTKLFLVMGVSWVFEIISWSIDGLNFRWYWIVFDVINILRAVGVFAVYVCKPDILLALEDTHPCLKRVFGHFKRRCSDDLSSMTGSTTAAISPASAQFPNAQTSL